MKTAIMICLALLLAAVSATATQDLGATYVGSTACMDCHPDEYDSYKQYSKKASSGESVRILAEDLTEEELKGCFSCHTTGYGRPGGFESFKETPEMADLGCETCHGPGYGHVNMGGDPALIRTNLDVKDCQTCHNEERIGAFNYKPLLFGGAH